MSLSATTHRLRWTLLSTHRSCQIFYVVQTNSPYPHISCWRLYCHLKGCGAEYRFHIRLFLARCLFDVSSFNSQVGLRSVQKPFWQLQPSDNKFISAVVTVLIYHQHLFLLQPLYMAWCDLGKAEILLSLCWSVVAMETGDFLCLLLFQGLGGILEGSGLVFNKFCSVEFQRPLLSRVQAE